MSRAPLTGRLRADVTAADEAAQRAPAAIVRSKRSIAGEHLSQNVAYLAFLLLVGVFWIAGGSTFMSSRNWELILEQVPLLAMVACGMTFAITAGYIDLSVGSTVGLAALLGAMGYNQFGAIGLVACVGIGAAVGLANGIIFAYLRIPSFVVTLAAQVIIRAVVNMVSGGFAVYVGSANNPTTALSGYGAWPQVLFLLAAFVGLLWVVYNKTVFGQNLKALGGNEAVCRLFGVKVELMKIKVFTLVGAIAGCAAIISLADTGASGPTTGTGLELQAIAAVVLGGTPLTGARGSMLKTVVGALTLTMLADGLVIAGVGPNWNDVAQGALLITAIAIAIERKKIGVVK